MKGIRSGEFDRGFGWRRQGGQSHGLCGWIHTIADGIGAGVLARKGDLYYACIPNLWLLRDTKGTGSADFRKVLSKGYGVRVGFLGHDLHGLRFGPDGKLYFTIGDRGAHIPQPNGKVIELHETGAVLRCDPDGSNIEVFATGLRNRRKSPSTSSATCLRATTTRMAVTRPAGFTCGRRGLRLAHWLAVHQPAQRARSMARRTNVLSAL
jgi:hypothetical protein